MGAGSSRGRAKDVARRFGLSRAIKSTARAAGYDLVRRHYYSPVPDLSQVAPTIWSHRSELPGLEFDLGRSLEFLRAELAPRIDEYRPPAGATGDPRRFHLDNGFYESIDAETLYAMIRRFEPRRIVELGSGMSTLVIADACSRNPFAAEHVVFDPYPRPEIVRALGREADLREQPVADIADSEFAHLSDGDFLFVDTTHTVKVGSDVNRIILDVLPKLAPGVFVHFHDIFLPWEYPREFMVERSFFWAEQYLLQAFLAFNREFEILFSAHALQRCHSREVAELIPNVLPGTRPSAFWIRRRALGSP